MRILRVSTGDAQPNKKKTTASAVVCVATRIGVKSYLVIAVIKFGIANILCVDSITAVSSHNLNFLLKVEPIAFKSLLAQMPIGVAVGDFVHNKILLKLE